MIRIEITLAIQFARLVQVDQDPAATEVRVVQRVADGYEISLARPDAPIGTIHFAVLVKDDGRVVRPGSTHIYDLRPATKPHRLK